MAGKYPCKQARNLFTHALGHGRYCHSPGRQPKPAKYINKPSRTYLVENTKQIDKTYSQLTCLACLCWVLAKICHRQFLDICINLSWGVGGNKKVHITVSVQLHDQPYSKHTVSSNLCKQLQLCTCITITSMCDNLVLRVMMMTWR